MFCVALAFLNALIPNRTPSATPPIIIPSRTFFNLPSISVSSTSVARYWVTALFNTGESNSTNISDNLPSLGSKTVRSATAPAVNPLNAVTPKPPTNPAPLRNRLGKKYPPRNLDTPSVTLPAKVLGL